MAYCHKHHLPLKEQSNVELQRIPTLFSYTVEKGMAFETDGFLLLKNISGTTRLARGAREEPGTQLAYTPETSQKGLLGDQTKSRP